MQNIKEAWKNMPGKTKNIILAIAVGTVFLAVIGIAVLNLSSDKRYSTLFVGMNREDAQAVVSLLQDDGTVSYTHLLQRCLLFHQIFNRHPFFYRRNKCCCLFCYHVPFSFHYSCDSRIISALKILWLHFSNRSNHYLSKPP